MEWSMKREDWSPALSEVNTTCTKPYTCFFFFSTFHARASRDMNHVRSKGA